MIKRLLLPLLIALAVSGPAHAYKFASGSYTGDGKDDRPIDISDTTTPSVADFTPDVVFIKCDGATESVWRSSAMAGDLSYTPITSTAGVANLVQALTSTGFTVGTDTRVNASGVLCWYVALANDASNDLAVGSYTGDGNDNRNITISPAFTPQVVFIQESSTGSAQMAFNVTGTDETPLIPNTAAAANRIQAFNADGFQVGSSVITNVDTLTYYYLAIKAVSGSTAAGTFTGDTNDSRQITSLGFQPEFMVIRGNSTSTAACARFKDHSGDDSVRMSAQASITNGIQNFLANGFEVGTDSCANESTVTMYWYALKAQPAVSTPARRIIRYQ